LVDVLERLVRGDVGQRLATLGDLQGAAPAALRDRDLRQAVLRALADPIKAVQRAASAVAIEMARADRGFEQELVARLVDPDPRRRWAAAFVLGRLDRWVPQALPVLVDQLGGRDGDLRWAAQALLVRGCRRDPAARSAVVELARSGASLQRKMTLFVLRDLGQVDAAVERLALAGLADPDREVALAAISLVIRLELRGPELVAALSALERSAAHAGLRRAAQAALDRLERRAFRPPGGRDPLEDAEQA
jgi:hypothetical protein